MLLTATADPHEVIKISSSAKIKISPSATYGRINIRGKKIHAKIKGAVTDMRYFARSKFFRSYVHKKNFSFTYFVKRGIPLLGLNELGDNNSR